MNLNILRAFALTLIIIAIKPFEFIASNIMVANNFNDLFYPLFASVGFSLILILIFFPLSYFLKKRYLIRIILFIGFVYYFQFYWIGTSNNITSVFSLTNKSSISKFISLFLIIIMSVALVYFCQKKKFFRFAFIISSFVLISQIMLSVINFSKDISILSDINQSRNKESSIKHHKNKTNVYYFILDGMTSIDYLNNASVDETKEYTDFVNKIEVFDFHHLSKSRSSYNITYLTLGSILNLDYFSNDIAYKDRFSFFPFMLHKKESPKLIKELNKIDYKFFYSGNSGWADCRPEKVQNIKCINKPFDSSFKKFFSNEMMIAFLRNSVIFRIQNTIIGLNDYQVDGIENFRSFLDESISPNQASFYFIHNLSPHPPYFDDNCIINFSIGKKNWGSIKSYHQSINCVLKELFMVIENIIYKDPDSIIVIQGDHGTEFNYDWYASPKTLNYDSLNERFSIFNAIKLPKDCDQPLSFQYDNVDTIKLVMACINRTNAVQPRNKSFAGVYWGNNEFGYLTEVTKELKTED